MNKYEFICTILTIVLIFICVVYYITIDNIVYLKTKSIKDKKED